MLASDELMPRALATRLHRQLVEAPALAWRERRCDAPAYRFRELRAQHLPTCRCAVCTARARLASAEICVALAQAMGVDGLALAGNMVTWFDVDDFLAPHTDEPNGHAAFVWNLSAGWRGELGGVLTILSPTGARAAVPAFNRFVVFEVVDGRSPHFVSRVTAAARGLRRFAISGWYRKA